MRICAEEENFREIMLKGKKAFFSEMRIERSSIPEGLYVYEVRHDEEDWTEPVEIKRGILVNFLGTLISTEPLLQDDEDFMDIESSDEWEEIMTCEEKGLGFLLKKN